MSEIVYDFGDPPEERYRICELRIRDATRTELVMVSFHAKEGLNTTATALIKKALQRREKSKELLRLESIPGGKWSHTTQIDVLLDKSFHDRLRRFTDAHENGSQWQIHVTMRMLLEEELTLRLADARQGDSKLGDLFAAEEFDPRYPTGRPPDET